LCLTLTEADGSISILGPAPAPLARLRSKWRWHVLVKASCRQRLCAMIATFMTRFASARSVAFGGLISTQFPCFERRSSSGAGDLSRRDREAERRRARCQVARVLILRRSNQVLRRRAREVRKIDASVRALLPAMEQMMHLTDGVGLAGPQVGVPQRIAVIDVGDGLITLVNPRSCLAGAARSWTKVVSVCRAVWLSDPLRRGRVEARDEHGKLRRIKGTGMLARALQHEIDHLNGVLFVDRADPDSLHWLVKSSEPRTAEAVPTTLEQALHVFESGPPTREVAEKAEG